MLAQPKVVLASPFCRVWGGRAALSIFILAAGSYSYKQKHSKELFVWPFSTPKLAHVRRRASLEERAGCARFVKGYNGLVDCGYKLRGDDEVRKDMAIIEFNTRLTGHFLTMPPISVFEMMKVYVQESIRQGRR